MRKEIERILVWKNDKQYIDLDYVNSSIDQICSLLDEELKKQLTTQKRLLFKFFISRLEKLKARTESQEELTGLQQMMFDEVNENIDQLIKELKMSNNTDNISEELYKRYCKGEFRENISFNFIPDYYVGYDLPHITITAKKLQITPKLYSMFIELIEKIHKECGGVNYE